MKKIACFLLSMVLGVSLFSQTKTGTLKIFSELTGIVVYLDENRQGENAQQINDIPVGSHYLKVLLGSVSVYGELIEIKEGAVTTVLIKNTGQVQEKILDTKTAEKETYNNSKLDIILSRGMSTTTRGYSNLFPGYYSYWGYSSSVSSSVETTDWKIIQGGVKEISESVFAGLTDNLNLQNTINLEWKKYSKKIGTSAIVGIISMIPTGLILADILDSKPKSWLFPDTKKGSTAEAAVFAISATACIISLTICLKSPEPHGHHISVEDAAKESQKYNRLLKIKLGLPENYDAK